MKNCTKHMKKFNAKACLSAASMMILLACSSETVVLDEKSAPTLSDMSMADVTGTWAEGCDEAFKNIVANSKADSPISIPWLTIYDKNNQIVLHKNGYSSNSLSQWNKLLKGKSYESSGPSLDNVMKYSGVTKESIPESDLIFVKYSADWCAPCKSQSADLKVFKEQNPDVRVAHVEIIADAKDMRGICPL